MTDWSKSTHQKKIEKFMRLAGQTVRDKPGKPTDKERILRARLILEEALELIHDGLGIDIIISTDKSDSNLRNNIMGSDFSPNPLILRGLEASMTFLPVKEFDLEKTIDGACDLSVVTIGTMSCVGVPDIPFLDIVDDNNLEKIEKGRIDEYGKLIKPEGHRPPDIKGLLLELETEHGTEHGKAETGDEEGSEDKRVEMG